MIYMNNAATSFPKAPGTAEKTAQYILETGANAGRSSHRGAREASKIVFECRETVAEILGIEDSSRLIFTSSTTEALNTAIFGILKNGDTVLTSSIEHNSVMRPLRFLEKERGIRIVKFKADSIGRPDMNDFKKKLDSGTDLLIFAAASNVTGVVVPFEEMTAAANKRGIPVCIDGAQLAGSYPVNIGEIPVDLFAFPGHKGLLGPAGTGGLYIKEGTDLKPLILGGTGSRSDEEIQPDFLPDKFESGTMNIPGLAGLLNSAEFIIKTGVDRIHKRELELSRMLDKGLRSIEGVKTFFSGGDKQTAVVSMIHCRYSASDITGELDKADVAVRMGLHCAPAAHRTIGTFETGGTVRFSPGFFTMESEVEETLRIMREILK